MKLATTTSDFAMYARNYEECVKFIHDAGFRYIDFGMTDRRYYTSPTWKDEVKRLRDYAESLDMKFVQMHSPEGNPFNLEKREDLIELTKRSIEVCEIMGIPQTVVHSGCKEWISKEEYFESTLDFYKALFPTMEKTGVNVLIENTSSCNLPAEKYYLFLTGQQMVEFLDYANHPLLHAVWDTGHGNTEGNQYDQVTALGKHLYGIHVHDNSGKSDEHKIPYFGTINMDDLMNGLVDVGYEGYFTFEVLNTLKYTISGKSRRSFEGEKKLLNPTVEMQIDVDRLLYTIGKHCLTSYGVFEE